MFKIFNNDSALLATAKSLADELAERRGHAMYVIHMCDDDYEVTAQVPSHYEYRADP